MPDLSTVMQRSSNSMLDASSRSIGVLWPESGCLSKERAQTHGKGFDHNASPSFCERDRSKILRLIWGLARFGQPSHPGIRPELMKFVRVPPQLRAECRQMWNDDILA